MHWKRKNPIKIYEIGFYKSTDTASDLIQIWALFKMEYSISAHVLSCNILPPIRNTLYRFYYYCHQLSVEISINYFTRFHFPTKVCVIARSGSKKTHVSLNLVWLAMLRTAIDTGSVLTDSLNSTTAPTDLCLPARTVA